MDAGLRRRMVQGVFRREAKADTLPDYPIKNADIIGSALRRAWKDRSFDGQVITLGKALNTPKRAPRGLNVPHSGFAAFEAMALTTRYRIDCGVRVLATAMSAPGAEAEDVLSRLNPAYDRLEQAMAQTPPSHRERWLIHVMQAAITNPTPALINRVLIALDQWELLDNLKSLINERPVYPQLREVALDFLDRLIVRDTGQVRLEATRREASPADSDPVPPYPAADLARSEPEKEAGAAFSPA